MKKHKTVSNTWQQGDLLGRRIDSIPVGKQKVLAKGRCVLADGEHTGHQHVIESADAELIQIGELILLNLTSQATVKHPEHKPITLSPGIWEIGRVKEYDWLSKMERQVMD